MWQYHLDNIIFSYQHGEFFFPRFSMIHSFDKPNDETALRLMNASASLMMELFPDIIFGYGFSNEYRCVILLQNGWFCMEKTTKKIHIKQKYVFPHSTIFPLVNNSNLNWIYWQYKGSCWSCKWTSQRSLHDSTLQFGHSLCVCLMADLNLCCNDYF